MQHCLTLYINSQNHLDCMTEKAIVINHSNNSYHAIHTRSKHLPNPGPTERVRGMTSSTNKATLIFYMTTHNKDTRNT